LVTVVTSPIFGKIVDSTGYNLIWVILSIVLAMISHLILMFTFLNSFVPVLILGASLSLLYASLWPMVSLVVPNNQLSSAFGLVQSFQNLGLAIISILTGLIVQNYGYFVLELFFLTLCLIGLLTASLLYFVDQARGKIY
jgi:MFS family permease